MFLLFGQQLKRCKLFFVSNMVRSLVEILKCVSFLIISSGLCFLRFWILPVGFRTLDILVSPFWMWIVIGCCQIISKLPFLFFHIALRKLMLIYIWMINCCVVLLLLKLWTIIFLVIILGMIALKFFGLTISLLQRLSFVADFSNLGFLLRKFYIGTGLPWSLGVVCARRMRNLFVNF